MIKAVIYDMDGVLIDSEPFWRLAEKEVFKQVGIELTDEDCASTAGLRIDEVIAHWHEKHPWNSPSQKEIETQIMQKMVVFISTYGEPLKGVKHSLDFFKSKGYRIALASSSQYVLIETVLKRLNIADYFSVVHSAEEEDYGKPHPAVFLSTAKKLGVSPTQCLVIEDTLNGVIAGLAAKMKVIAIPEEINQNNTRFLVAHKVLTSLEEVDDKVLGKLA